MNPFIKKEIRLLLPAFLIGCGLALTNGVLGQLGGQNLTQFAGPRAVIPYLLCPVIAIMIALDSFGAEVASGTFASLLAQPVPRQKIWETKTSVLAISLLIMGIIYCAAIFFRQAMLGAPHVFADWLNVLCPVILFILVVYSGALWTVLLLRQAAAAFWFTVLVPGVIIVVFAGFFDGQDDELIEGMLVIALGLYSLAGFFLARWLFMRAQDLQWSGGTIAMPELRGLPAWISRLTAWRVTHPRAALWRKEFQLQQSQLIMAFVLALLHLGVIATLKWGHFERNSSMEFVLQTFWMLWLVLPFMVGCAAVAEERKFGTHESQLCLPVKRRTQFAIKLSVVLSLSLLLGVAMPLLFEGGRILPNAHSAFLDAYRTQLRETPAALIAQSFFFKCYAALNSYSPLLLFMGIAAGIGLLSFFISTLTRNTLQALAPATAYSVFLGFCVFTAGRESWSYHPLWRGDLIYIISVPVMSLTLLSLAYRNFRQATPDWKIWLWNLLALAASLVVIATMTTAVYHRVWEKLTPFEPPHGLARLTLSNPASISEQYNSDIFVRLPDGKTWTDYWSRNSPASLLAFVLGNFKVTGGTGTYLPGSDWKTVKRAPWWELVGIKNDGTLWVSEKPWPRRVLGRNGFQDAENAMLHLVQFGDETNWSSLQPLYSCVLLIKTDGTLWRWGSPDFDVNHKPWPGLRTFTPERLGLGSNWAGFLGSYFLRKTDGIVWADEDVNAGETNSETELRIGGGWIFRPMTSPAPGKFRSTAAVGWNLQAAILHDGAFCIWAIQETYPGNRHEGLSYWKWAEIDLPIGHETNWLAVATSHESWNAVTLKDDGTLWSWDFGYNLHSGWASNNDDIERAIQKTVPVRLGTHSDWIAIASGNGYVLSLATDGSLWYWPMEEPSNYYHYSDDQPFEPLLDISRKPQLLGNVFSVVSSNR
ncbi:MAG TPA: ABC transporter permease subunit [Verrucomicrobiae bacterium]|nr:ABC transporter permease subunit [Verrucomicrobiae bacterium]